MTREGRRGTSRGAIGAMVSAAIALCACDSGAKPAPEASRGGKVALVAAPPGEEVAALVARERDKARASGGRLVVYVGASWCEPCTRFHDAAKAGELDATFPGLVLLEFDHDRDEARLETAGYASKMIPLFAIPGPDGRASGKQLEGAIKGKGAVGFIAPRLRRLLDESGDL